MTVLCIRVVPPGSEAAAFVDKWRRSCQVWKAPGLDAAPGVGWGACLMLRASHSNPGGRRPCGPREPSSFPGGVPVPRTVTCGLGGSCRLPARARRRCRYYPVLVRRETHTTRNLIHVLMAWACRVQAVGMMALRTRLASHC
jgi:hypothetical protein